MLLDLIKRYKRFDESGNIDTNDAFLFFSSLKCASHEVKAYSFSHFVRKWTKLLDLGGLIKVNVQFVLFIRYVETLVRKKLTFLFMKTYKGEHLRKLLH